MSDENNNTISHLAELYGISNDYINCTGEYVSIPDELKLLSLRAMGVNANNEKQIDQEITKYQQDDWENLLPPAHVVHRKQVFSVPITMPISRLNNTYKGVMEFESGEKKFFEVKASQLKKLDSKVIKGKEFVRLSIELPKDFPLGYHRLYLKNRSLEAHCLLIVVPETCYEPEAVKQGNKIWGVSTQLYTVRSENNWGIGDFSDLKTLVIKLGRQSADFVGLNPIHSLYPINPEHCSPYSPSSRKFINPLYIDITDIDDFQECEQARQLYDTQNIQTRLQQARDAEYIDYKQVASLKFEFLEILFSHFNQHHWKVKTSRGKAFAKFRKHRGKSLEQHALYEALYEHFNELGNNSWHCWPEPFHSRNSQEVKSFARQHKDRILYYSWLQWLAERQLEEAQLAALEAGMCIGIYRDLAVGVDRNGSDAWNDQEHYCLDISVGAPPDILAPQGQNWGLPPFNPIVLARHHYKPFIEMVRANMSHCGALRIDHVMGLLRLWWCPNEKSADNGVYVNYPLDDMLGIIKLESQRHQCLVFGEDLGTVPEKIQAKLPPARCYSNEVILFSCKGDRFMAAGEYKQQALTCVSNHDIPTLKAWWNCNDLDLRQSLNIYRAEYTQREKEARHKEKVALLNTLKDIDELPWQVDPYDISTMGYSRDIMEKIHYYLAKTASRMVVIQLEDMLELDTPVNVPGTCTEYPNWKRKLTKNLSVFFNTAETKGFLKNFSLIRQA
ncbi:MAG: 4-alpha-glucanotransferase [Endozoicomonas sp. (ex Botrylloides leachii)]|nr:4-alpha-glucanotransferase [Endozoicomonas sp. (ex Botrylloides leachii)]